MKLLTLVSLMLASSLTFSYTAEFPKNPVGTLTPGSLCERASEYRYPEQIAYCKRDVSSTQKRDIFEDYRGLGFNLDPRKRSSYKIDHYIPLCAGGSNRDDNLWPQHISIYTITDPMEGLGCEKLLAAKIKQKELVRLIKLVKNDLSKATSTIRYLQSL
ncbi:MAG TPA: hypothetical protein VNJ08_07795 [Bacteriovoracaceae bacterium]|nr:hypothetical protein [Bacteriovoracaceae bacterium]